MQPTTSAYKRGRKAPSFAAVALAIVSVTAQIIALAAVTCGLAPAPRNQATPVMASAMLRSVECAAGVSGSCPAGTLAGVKQAERIEVPSGAAPCPNSGAGASCGPAAATTQIGTAALPAGAAACPVDPSKPVAGLPGACSDAAPDPGSGQANLQAAPAPPVQPTITLSADKTALAGGSTALLQVRSNMSMTGTPWAIEIFDMTSRVLVGTCAQSSVCTVAYTGGMGRRTFVAFVMAPGPKVPAGTAAAVSNALDIRWLGAWVAIADGAIVAPGKPITFTASASEDVSKIGYRIELRDSRSGQLLTFCSQGTTCSTSLVEPTAVTRSVVAQLVPESPAAQAAAASLNLTSQSVSGTWLGVQLVSSGGAGPQGGTMSLTATANADLSQTPWSIFIQNEKGQLAGQPCNAGTCTVTITLGPHDSSSYRALIGQTVPSAGAAGPLAPGLHAVAQPRLDVLATSQFVRPSRLLWGVDSCQPMTEDSGGGNGLLPQVVWWLGGMPDFWGRYLPSTGNCPGLSWAEIAAAHKYHIGILPIYNDYDCSAVVGYSAGAAYGEHAAALAVADGIPGGVGIAIDIEPPGDACPGAANVDTGFIQGWYDVIVHYHYVPVFYGNSAFGSAFAAAWCTTVTARPEIAAGSFVWSFEPSLQNSQARSAAPAFAPGQAGCAGYTIAWQYQLSAGSSPNVDTDEADSVFPFWWP